MAVLPPYGDVTRPTVAWSVVAVACVANFLDLFQSSMVLFGLPPIQEDLNFTVEEINWVLVAYTVTFATFLLIGGQVADRAGLRTSFLLGTATLTWSNILCAFTPNQSGLLAGRALAGAGAAFTVRPCFIRARPHHSLSVDSYGYLNNQPCIPSREKSGGGPRALCLVWTYRYSVRCHHWCTPHRYISPS